MDWKNLLSWERLWKKDEHEDPERSAFQRDFDRIVFSSSFRRLQDKTQVFPMAESDYVRTRLTHSIEVSSVGRSLGKKAGTHIMGELEKLGLVPAHVGEIVAAACLAHDIGNPPFGHSGEEAIAEWFRLNKAEFLNDLPPAQEQDFLRFEGNAQGFRHLVRLQHRHNNGGMQLTHAVLGAFTKYPRPSFIENPSEGRKLSEKKHGFFDQDRKAFEEVAGKAGLIRKPNGAWVRHPLAFLVEAADDICYHIVDFEDGHRLGRVTFDEAEAHLGPIAFAERPADKTSYPSIDSSDKVTKVQYLRAQAIGTLVTAAAKAFNENIPAMMEGTLEQGLVDLTPFGDKLKAIKKLSFEKVYGSRKVVEIEAAGYEVLGGLLDAFVPALFEDDMNPRLKKILQLVPPEFAAAKKGTQYERLLAATDFISGMTDSYALSLCRKLSGIELPRGG